MISLPRMPAAGARAIPAALALALVLSPGCRGPLVRQYEYEEEMLLGLDGSADIVVNSSIAALRALHGFDLPVDPRLRFDRGRIRSLYETSGANVTRVSRPWRRAGRRFVQIRLSTHDVRTMSAHPAFRWASYRFERRDALLVFRQVVGEPAGLDVGDAGWDGSELVAFRLHLPSRIRYHNARDIDRAGAPRGVERGNILRWEQRLADRRRGVPVEIEVRMEPESILRRTLSLFALAFGAAMAALAGVIWWIRSRGPESADQTGQAERS
jgi:hypothetical protein